MRLGLIADIHGNLIALDAVLAELRAEGVDELLCLGDVAVGPQPEETLERIEELGCPVIMGNWDSYFLDGFPNQETELGQRLVEMGAWWAGKLTPRNREFLESFERSLELPLDGVRLLAVHGSPRSFEDFIFPTTPDDEVEEMLDGASAPLMLAGHTHFPMLRRYEEMLLVNPGSVGLPFAGPGPVMRICPWAEYAILEIVDGRWSVDHRRTDFDLEAHLGLIRRSGMPHADWWAGLWNARGSDPLEGG
jgi:putative phosphoesterase